MPITKIGPHLFMLAAALMVLASCSQDDATAPAQQQEIREVAVQADRDIKADTTRLRERIIAALAANETIPGMAVTVVGPHGAGMFSASSGKAAPDGTHFFPITPVRIASVTKTYVAATVLRLMEQGEVDLAAPIAELVDPQINQMLTEGGYDTEAMTVRHILTHTAGLADHIDDNYVGMIMENPARHWTREEQVALAMEGRSPLGPPDNQFSYSDTGYILLGHVIERVTGTPLATAVREQLSFADIGLAHTWWEQVEEAPANAAPRAHQYLDGRDITDWHPSIDLYGGGGLVASTDDMALFMAALMRGQVFDKPDTLDIMQSAPGTSFPDQARFGLFAHKLGGQPVYSHSGFWGTYLLYAPELDVIIAGTVLDQTGFEALTQVLAETLEDLGSAPE